MRIHQFVIRTIAALSILTLAVGCMPRESDTSVQPTEPYPPLLLVDRPYAQPTPEQELWALGIVAIFTEVYGGDHTQLGGLASTPGGSLAYQDLLSDEWGIKNAEDLDESLRWLEKGGDRRAFDALLVMVRSDEPAEMDRLLARAERDSEFAADFALVGEYEGVLKPKGIAAWDYGRYIALCGWAVGAGYIDEAEAWERMMPAAITLQQTFDSWEDMGFSFLLGREYWLDSEEERSGGFMHEMYNVYDRLPTESDSPWATLDWELPLGVE